MWLTWFLAAVLQDFAVLCRFEAQPHMANSQFVDVSVQFPFAGQSVHVCRFQVKARLNFIRLEASLPRHIPRLLSFRSIRLNIRAPAHRFTLAAQRAILESGLYFLSVCTAHGQSATVNKAQLPSSFEFIQPDRECWVDEIALMDPPKVRKGLRKYIKLPNFSIGSPRCRLNLDIFLIALAISDLAGT